MLLKRSSLIGSRVLLNKSHASDNLFIRAFERSVILTTHRRQRGFVLSSFNRRIPLLPTVSGGLGGPRGHFWEDEPEGLLTLGLKRRQDG